MAVDADHQHDHDHHHSPPSLAPAVMTSDSPSTSPPPPPPYRWANTAAADHIHTPPSFDRPRLSRHSSLPRALFSAGSASIFGSAPTPSTSDPLSPEHIPAEVPVHTPRSQPPVLKDHRYPRDAPMSSSSRLLPRAEKDTDDPTTPPPCTRAYRRTGSSTLTTLSRLFAVQAATSPDHSRAPSYSLSHRHPFSYQRSVQSAETAALPDHLYTRGLLGGRHSDITVHAFGQQYKLHRLILDRSPFFASALSEPWMEAQAKDMRVQPEDIDGSITQASFELALRRLYGCYSLAEEDVDPVGLFATGCWLEMQDLIDSSVGSMLRQMSPETLSPLIKLVTSNYYGRAGDKILASAKSLLCRDGWQMPLRYWDGIPGDIVREIVGGDGFYIESEMDRWVLAKRILDRRLRSEAIANGLLEPGSRHKIRKVPEAAKLMAFRFDSVYRRSNGASGTGVHDSLHKWITLYTHPDVEPLLVLLDEGIHYLHMDFEQLQFIRKARDCLGLPVIPEKVISNALWQQMELRQRVINSKDGDQELGLSEECTEEPLVNINRDTTMSITNSSDLKGKKKVLDPEEASDDIASGSWDGNGKPRKFWIPSSDCNIVMGGNAEPVIATSTSSSMQRHATRLSASLQPEDIQWAADFAAFTAQPRPPAMAGDNVPVNQHDSTAIRFSHLPPFRFAAEFPNPRLLKEKKRVYSRTVFYAGSLWNIYIQKVASPRSKQLGVYLHRAKEREAEEVIAGTAGLAQGSVDERIGQLEREMTLRGEYRNRRQRRRPFIGTESLDADDADSSASGGIEDASLLSSGPEIASGSSADARPGAGSGLLSRRQHKTGQTDLLDLPLLQDDRHLSAEDLSDSASADQEDSEDCEGLAAASSKLHVPTLPPYVDTRPTIKTYFKIYSPSRAGLIMSAYESAPDQFNFSQSWGWKSSSLMLDEGLLGEEDDSKDDPDVAIENTTRRGKEKGDGKLRFMVVIGNI